ncbi:glycosyltransferase [Nitrospira sp. BLG_1]|uniref:glycosyltransferase n=1 Tax=Nitrospira sp. BLG_1 TaxID=3395883 RepID=UPI0039BCCD01
MNCRLLYLVGQLGLGGLEHQLFCLIQAMDRRRYQPVIAVWGNSPNDHFAPKIRALDVPVIVLGTEPRRLARLQTLSSLVSDLRPEVIHSYSFYTNILAWWVARDTAAIPIGAVQSSFISERRHKTLLSKLSARWPHAQIFNSSTAAQNADRIATSFRPARSYVVKNGVDLDKFSPQLHPERGYILAVGSLMPVKRWDRLLRVIACLKGKGVEFEVLHAGSGPLREELEVMARGMHVEHVIRFLGNRDDIPSLLAGAAFLVHTSDVEGLPNVVLEAMACGRAVVGTDVGDVPFLIDDGKTGFVVSRQDETALANRMATLLADRELSFRMGEAGRLKAEQEFSLERLVSETFAVYRTEGWKDR